MAGLRFEGRADAYLEWAVASGFRWLYRDAARSDRVDLLVDDGYGLIAPWASPRALLTTGASALPAWSWMELAQALTVSRPALLKQLQAFADPGRVVLGLIDSGIGVQWLKGWKGSLKKPIRQVFHWDMEGASAAPMPRISHGAHVLSWMAGQPPYTDFGFDADIASGCPLMLVNLPDAAVYDPTGRWLGRYVLDGLDYMVDQAIYIRAKRLVVNISWGPQTGPHDGSSLLERALGQRIVLAKQQLLDLSIVVAAGNSRESRAHAQFDADKGCQSLTWVVPPAGPAPSFLELWWPQATDLSQAQATVQAPDGRLLELAGAGLVSQPHAHLVIVPHLSAANGMRPMALLALNPTGDTAQAAPHGRWQVSVKGIAGAAGRVHAYVARQTANLGGAYRGPDSYLDDPSYGQQGFARRPGPPRLGSWVAREGTLSGLATAAHAQVYAAAGAVLSTGEAAAYSSEGPSAGGGTRRPDWALPTDETPLLKGLLGAGARSGSVVRLVGTSMAAPQLARLLLNGPPPLPPSSPWDRRLGHGLAQLGWRSRQRA